MFFERPFIIISFSSTHRVQFRFPFLPAGICLTKAHLIENCRFSFFRFQTCLDNSVCYVYILKINLSSQIENLSFQCVEKALQRKNASTLFSLSLLFPNSVTYHPIARVGWVSSCVLGQCCTLLAVFSVIPCCRILPSQAT